jgi:hypothetical protein
MVDDKLTYHTSVLKRYSLTEITSNINRTILRVFSATTAWYASSDCGQRRFLRVS